MILHIMTDNIFSKDFMEYINQSYDSQNHLFIVYNANPEKFKFKYDLTFHNVYLFGKSIDFNELKSLCVSAKCILLHSLFIKYEFFKIFIFHKSICRKCIPIFWGGDLYENEFPHIKDKIKHSIRTYFTKYLINYSKGIGYLTEQDFICFKRRYKLNKEGYSLIYSMQYLNKEYWSLLEKLRKEKLDLEKIRIQIGHSCDSSLNHVKVLNDISNCNDKSIEVYMPLSYGDLKYQSQVIDIGKQLYKEHFHPITEYMDMIRYTQLLSTMDVLIMFTDRQIGLGNIYTSVLLNTVVCVKKKSPLSIFLTQEIGLQLMYYDEEVELSKFDTSKIDKEHNIKLMKDYLSKKNFHEKWDPLLESEVVYES